MKKTIYTHFFLLLFLSLNSQVGLLWEKGIANPSSTVGVVYDVHGSCLDKSNNYYTTGEFVGKLDFDPSPNSFFLNSKNASNTFITKLGPDGNFKWAKQLGDTLGSTQRPGCIITDTIGNLYITGLFYGTSDFDPGPSEYKLTATGFSSDIYIVKLDSNGNLIWAKSYKGNKDDMGKGLAIDNLGFIYVTGSFEDSIDFNPSNPDFKFKCISHKDVFVLKLSSNGSFIWAKHLGSYGLDEGNSVNIDKNQNIVVTGQYSEYGDFDQSADSFYLHYGSLFIAKLTSNGKVIWIKGIGADGYSSSSKLDHNDNIIITGKYRYSADLDPDTSNFLLPYPIGQDDIFICKLDSSGKFQWGNAIGANGFDVAYSLSIDPINDIYISGKFAGTADFDPGLDSFKLTSNYDDDIFFLKLKENGSFNWVRRIGGIDDEATKSISLDKDGKNLYASGTFQEIVDFDFTDSVYYDTCSAFGYRKVFNLKLAVKLDTPFITKIIGDTFLCSNMNAIYSTPAIPGAISYTWTLPSGWIGTSTSNSINVVSGSTNGFITVKATGIYGITNIKSIYVQLISPPSSPSQVLVSSNPVCLGQSTTINATANNATEILVYTNSLNGTLLGKIPFSIAPNSTNTYYLEAKRGGCSHIGLRIPVMISVLPLPVVSYTQSPNPICRNNSKIKLSQANPKGGKYFGAGVFTDSIDVSSVVGNSTIITYTYVDQNNCSNSDTQTLFIFPRTNVNYIQSPSVLCLNSSTITLSPGTPSGGSYIGKGVNINKFNPQIAGIGTHIVSYIFTDANLCKNSTMQAIKVDACAKIYANSIPKYFLTYKLESQEIQISNLNFNKLYSVKIYNIDGRKLLEKTLEIGNINCSINCSNFNKGVIIIEIEEDNEISFSKFIIF